MANRKRSEPDCQDTKGLCGRPESEWLDRLDFLVKRLATATSCRLQTGTYWVSDGQESASSSLVTRVRSHQPLSGITSDYWEGAICYTKNRDEQSYSDVFAFPFLNKVPVVRRGPINLNDETDEVDEFRWFQWDEGAFVDRGWSYPDGPGEWGWIKKPGDEYWQTVEVRALRPHYEFGAPILIGLSNIEIPKTHQLLQRSIGRISLIHVNRDREQTNLFPWGVQLPRPNSPHVLPIQLVKFTQSEEADVLIDLATFRIRGGWIPGKYHIAVRVQNCRKPGEWEYSSDISAPFQINII